MLYVSKDGKPGVPVPEAEPSHRSLILRGRIDSIRRSTGAVRLTFKDHESLTVYLPPEDVKTIPTLGEIVLTASWYDFDPTGDLPQD